MRHLLPLLALACTPDPADEPDPLPPYDEPGPYTAGTSEGTVDGSTGESLPVTVWYPSTGSGDDAVRYGGLLAGEAFTDVAPACDEPRPVLLFSHGYGGVRYQSPYLGEHLASHGWITVAPDHVGNTFSNATAPVEVIAARRPVDIADAYDWLLDENDDPDGPLFGCVDDTEGYAVSGHSFGGYTAYATGGAEINDLTGGTLYLSDERVWAVITFAPWNAGGAISDGTTDIAVPVMTLGGSRDITTPWAMVSGLHSPVTTEPRRLGRFPDGGHYTFSPVACTLPNNVGDGCGPGFVPLEVASALTGTAVLAFLDDVRGIEGAAAEIPPESADLVWDDAVP